MLVLSGNNSLLPPRTLVPPLYLDFSSSVLWSSTEPTCRELHPQAPLEPEPSYKCIDMGSMSAGPSHSGEYQNLLTHQPSLQTPSLDEPKVVPGFLALSHRGHLSIVQTRSRPETFQHL